MPTSYLLKNLPTRRDLATLGRMYPIPDVSAVETFFSLLGVAGDVLSSTNSQMAKHKTSFGKIRVLAQLVRQPDQRLTPCELAKRIGVTRATVTGLLDGLEKCGYLRREGSREDRRSVSVHLLPAGRRFLETVMPDRFRHMAKIMTRLNRQERNVLQKLLIKVAEGVAEAGRNR
ncbi:MAG: MarR family transcriptional regulator [Pseudomonadota bacterium]